MSSQGYLIFGRKPVQEFIKESPDRNTVEAVFIADSFPAKMRQDLQNALQGLRFKQLPRKELDLQFPGVHHQGVVIRLIPGKGPASRGKENWKEVLEAHEGLIVVTDRIQDPQNLGSIMRSTEALGARALFITGRGAAPGPTSDRVSAGASFHLEHHVISNLENFLNEARKRDYWICASSSPDDTPENLSGVQLFSDDLSGLPPTGNLVLVIGNEGEGVKMSSLAKADFRIAIPLRGKTGSLNAGVATGILIDRIINRDYNP